MYVRPQPCLPCRHRAQRAWGHHPATVVNYVIKRDAIRASGLYFSEIREFDSESVPPGW